ncbi:MAG: phage integrase SAM-like domain-containing protein, partial [Bacteroidaceae bacterium]|nr:phage integrase SAM-like domain-containing protein [Bacteroidaceae bacterium]
MENIDQLLDKLATQLSGTNALIQVLIGDECYVRKVGDLNQIANNPHRVEPATDKPFLPWMLQQIDRSHIARGTYANHKSTYDVLSDFRPDMTFGSLDYQFLLDFEAY